MASNQKKLASIKKVFFITSSYSKGSNKLEYILQNCKALKNFKAGEKGEYITSQMHTNDKYTISVCSFELVESELNELKDEKTKKYKAKITLRDDRRHRFEGWITFWKTDKNSFIYDFKFNDYAGIFSTVPPPASIPFSKYEQFKLFMDCIKDKMKKKELKEESKDEIIVNLIQDSQYIVFHEPFYLDFFMSIFRECYSRKEIILFLRGFNLEKSSLPDNFNYNRYSLIMNMIEKKPNIIIQYCKNDTDKYKIYSKFYLLLFYLRRNFEKEKAEEMILNKDLYQYFAVLLPKYPSYFKNLICSNELIEQMFEKNSKELNLDIIKGILSYAGSMEKILEIINKNDMKIKKCAFEQKKKIIISRIGKPSELDDLNKIYDEICKIIKFEIQEKLNFISFNEELWRAYIDLNNDLKNLDLINKSIRICATLENELSTEILGLDEKIHNIGINSIQNGQLKNDEMLDFIELDTYFSDRNKAKKIFRPYQTILKGLDFDTMTDNFFDKWNKSNIFKIFEFEIYNFKNELVNILNNAKDIGKLLKLFDFNNHNLFDSSTRSIIRLKFKNVAPSFKLETCPNFIKDVAYYIYIIDKTDNRNIQEFLKNTIETYISSLDIKRDIYLYLASNYKDISNSAIESITNSILNNKSNLNADAIIFILEKINNQKIIKSLLNKLENFVIKEEEIFNQDNQFESFKLLDGIQQKNLLNKWEEIKYTKYLIKTFEIGETILSKIKAGEIKYNSFIKAWEKLETRPIFLNKIKILFFNNEDDVKICADKFKEIFTKTMKIKVGIDNLISIFTEFYKKKFKNEINHLENLKAQFQSGYVNQIENQKFPEKIEELKNVFKQEPEYPDFNEHLLLKQSLFFTHFFQKIKSTFLGKNDESDIFKKALEDFNLLKHFFVDDWLSQIPDPIIKECYKALKLNATEEKKEQKNVSAIGKELKTLSKYFKIKDFDINKSLTLEGHLITYSQKENIFSAANSCINFIEQLKAQKTEFFTELIKIRSNLKKKVSFVEINNFGLALEKYGIKVINSTNKDKDYLDILQFLSEKQDSLKFLVTLKGEDCRSLQELVTESEETFLTNNEIQDMIKCNEFIQKLIQTEKTDKELISDFIRAVNEESKAGITAIFKNFSTNSGQIRTLYEQKMNKSQATLKKIRNLMISSKFILSLTNKHEKYLEFIGKYKDADEQKEKDIDFEEIIELRGRAMLSKKLGEEKAKEEKEIFKYNKSYTERVNEIEKINQLMEKLGEKGYSENMKVIINIEDMKPEFKLDDEVLKGYDECSERLNNIFYKTSETQIKYYKDKRTELIRYIYGRQFTLFKNSANNNLEPFLKYLTNDSIKAKNLDKLSFEYNKELNEDKYICLMENINSFLTNFLAKNNITLEKIYEQNMVKKEFNGEYKGLYTKLLEDEKGGEVQGGIEEYILNWYYYLTNNIPMAQTLLLCNEETTSEEITAFLYRAFLCDYNVVFMVGKIESLEPEPRQTLTNLINSLFTLRGKKMNSCLVFAYSKKSESIVKYLEGIIGHKILERREAKPFEKKLYDENVKIIFSDKPGVGKSTSIKLMVEKKKKIYKHFPFGGEFSRKDIIKRLSELNIIDEEKTVIHLDLYDSRQTDLMKDFLYCFLVTKLYGQKENLFYLSKKVEIIIELPCGFINFFLKFPILNMFKNKEEMKIEKLPDLIVAPEINSNIQIVCNYLKFLKENKLADKDIIIKGVSLSAKDLGQIIDFKYVPNNVFENAQSLSQKECYSLIKENIGIKFPSYYQINSFIDVLSGQLRNFSMNYQMSAAYLIQCENMFTSLQNKNLKQLRVTMVKSFIKNTIHFTQGAFDSLLNSQSSAYNITIKQGKYNEVAQNEKAVEVLSDPNKKSKKITCREINPALVFFHEGNGQDFSIITNDKPNTNEYNNLLELRKIPIMIQNQFNKENGIEKREEIPKELKNYNLLKHKSFWEEIKQILNINNPTLNENKEPNRPEIKSIEEIVGDYVFTADNFVKMVLILLRIRANIPIIMMGETGCGKTSLIRKLYELTNNGVSNMEILNIHAGVTDDEIVHFLYDNKKKNNTIIKNSSIIERAKMLEKKENEIEKEFEEKGLIYFKKKFWVFLDEINTCNSMGLICEMMTKKSCQGKPLPNNIFFIAACNPYRYADKSEEEQNALEVVDKKNENKERSKLVYTVNPLPFSLLNFVFNFGDVTAEDEKSYIRNMVVSPIESFFWKEIEKAHKNEKLDRINIGEYLNEIELKKCEDLKKLASDAIIEGQQYVRKIKKDVSSVSLREIRRFGIFYNFFVEYLFKKKELDSKVNQNEKYNAVDTYYRDLTDKDIYLYSINISLFLCYYMRLTKKENREEFSKIMNKIFENNNYADFDFENIPNREQRYIADNIEMEKGIAKNKALLDNLFTLFVCVNSKVPLFIVGKPGCSKSLSVQLLYKSMIGTASNNTLFKSLPQLFINSYQGSKGSTSKGVLNIFKKARLILNDENKDKIISMIYFDEMGLAENSPNNPLKVIHSELEYDLNEGNKKIAFVGISNWCLDASKMNRGLFLSIPQPDLEDLNKTSQIIAESYNPHLAQTNSDLFEALANLYYNYKKILKKNYSDKQEYHGSRDFYHLIKIAMRQLLSKTLSEQDNQIDEHVKESIGINSIERNFSGLEFDDNNSSLKIIKTLFKEKYPNCDTEGNYNVIEKIRENIKDKDSRFLLLISKSSVSNYLINSILTSEEMKKDLKKELSFYIGSGFRKDQLSESYGLKILNKIQLQMEQDKILLLTDLESVYPSLYDLFNQNFTIVSGKKYSRIAMGSTNNTFSLVHDGFKCIVIVDKNMIEEEEPPFLNRFEKHIISFEILLRKELLQETENIYAIIQELGRTDIKENKLSIKYDLKRQLVNCDKEEIQGMIYIKDIEYQNLDKKKLLKVQDIQDIVLEKISLTLTQDIILIMKYSGFKEKYINIYNKIIEFYKRGEHSNLYNFIKSMKNLKNVVYTFTSIDEPLLANISGKFNTEMFGEIDRTNIKEIQISSLNSENELEAQLESIYLDRENKTKIIVIKFNPDETDIMNYIKFFIENYLKEKNYLEENSKKSFIFTVHMNRIFNEDVKDELKEDFVEKNTLGESISHLSDFYQICIDHLNGENFSLIDILDLNPENILKKSLKLDTEFMKNFYDAMSYFDYNFLISVEGIDTTNYANKLITFLDQNEELRQQIINCILKQNLGKLDIFEEILKKIDFKKNDVGIISVIQRHLSILFTNGLAKLVFKAENDNFLSTFIYNQNCNNGENNNKIDKNEIIEHEEEMNLNNYKDNNKIEVNNNYYLGNEIVRKLIELYLENLDISKTNIKRNKNENKISILLGLKLPGIYPLIKIFRQYIHEEIQFNFYDTERKIKFYLNQNDKDYPIKRQEYENELRNYQKCTEIEIGKNPIFKKLNELSKEHKEKFNEFNELLLNDYYLIFLSKIVNDINDSYKNIEEYNKVLKKMVFFRYESINEEDRLDPFKSFIMKIIWVESYSQNIAALLSIYKTLLSFEKNLFEKIEKLLDKDEIKFDIDERKNPEHSQIYLKPFYFILESLFTIIINDSNLYKENGQKFYDFINILKTVCKDGLNLTEELNIYSKGIFTIQQILDIEKRLNNVNKSNPDNILKVIEILKKQIEYSNDANKLDELSKNIKSLYDFLYENLGDTDNFVELILDLFVAEIKKQSYDNYRHDLIEIIFKNPKLIAHSYPFISIIIKRVVKPNIANIENNLDNLQQSESYSLKLINDSKNEIVHDIILSTFENLFNKYFESIPSLTKEDDQNCFPSYYNYIETHNEVNETLILFDKSLDIFRQCANLLEFIYNSRYDNKEEKIGNELLCQLYCIAYIKMYLFKLVHYINDNKYNQLIGDIGPITRAIKGNSDNSKVRQMMKIYVFKIFFYILNNNFHAFKNYNYDNHGIPFFKDLENRFEEEKIAMLSYYMIPYGDDNIYGKFMEDFEKFDSYRRSNFEKNIKEFKELIEKDGLDSFYIISTNLIISNLALENYVDNLNEYIKYSSFAKSIFQTLQIPEITKQLFLLYSSKDSFTDIMEKKIKNEENQQNMNANTFEILLYSLRFCLQTSNCNNPGEFLYSGIISKDNEKVISENCIPGNNLLNDRFITGYALLEKHINTQPPNVGAYVCSCGTYYAIEPCGFPRQKSNCLFCKKEIGYAPLPPGVKGSHGFVIRDGHYRIFKNEQVRAEQFGTHDSGENIKNKLINEYKIDVINPILKKSKLGINKPKKSIFQQFNHSVRKLSIVGYRLLNYILYSHLFYANCLNFISNEDIKNYICDEMTCIQMIETDWTLLKEALQSKGIQIIQIFMNLIFKKLSEKLKSCKKIETLEEREKFEDEIEKLLEEAYKEYEAYSKKYNEINEEALKLDRESMKALVLENNDTNNYDEKEYPFYKYFLMTIYPSKKSFIDDTKRTNLFERNYPLTSAYIDEKNKEKFLIKYLPDFNDFCNYMIDFYSYQVTRKYASERKIKDEELYKDQNFKEKLESFLEDWEKLKTYETKFECRDEMTVLDLNENSTLSHFLVDNGELYNGMYLAASYQNFIEWQNSFLDKLIESLNQSGILHHYVKNMEKKIDVQNAKKNDTLDFDEVNDIFTEIIYENSRRNILREDNSINYMNYKQYVYDFDSIEKNLGELILPGKVRFNGVENLKYVTYCFEGFRGNKSSILSDFMSKYTQKELSLEKKEIIYSIIKEKLNENNDELEKILFSIQLLIYYLIKERQIETEEIKTIIDDLPNYVNLSKECKDFFQEPKLTIKFEELMEVYIYLELLCFFNLKKTDDKKEEEEDDNPIIKNLRIEYKMPIEEKQSNDILSLFENKIFKLITKETLAVSCRRFISRYLVSNRDDIEYDEKNLLSLYLNRYELWPREFIEKNMNQILEDDLELLGKSELKVGQCYALYKLMNFDEKKEFEKVIVKGKEKKKANAGEGGRKDNFIKKKDRNKFKKILRDY